MKFINTHTQFKNGKFTITQHYNTKNSHVELSLSLSNEHVKALNLIFEEVGLPSLSKMATTNFVISDISKISQYTGLAQLSKNKATQDWLLQHANEASIELTGDTALAAKILHINQQVINEGEDEKVTEVQIEQTAHQMQKIFTFIDTFLDN